MRNSVVIHSPGSWEKLTLETSAIDQPKDDQVLIRCKAIGVNFADVCVRMGIYSSAKKFVGWPITPGFEVAGVVEAVGKDVTHVAVGDRVFALTLFGGYTTHLIALKSHVFPLPKNLTFEKAAAFPVIFLTAWYALFELAHPHIGDTLLVHSAAGGVGGALVQLGKSLGCKVIGVVGGKDKINSALALGADHVIDKSSEPIWQKAEALSPQGYRAIFDANGRETLQQSYNHLAPAGKLVVYGFHSMLSKGRGTPNWLKIILDWFMTPKFNPLQMTEANKSVLAFNLSFLFDKEHQTLFQNAIIQLVTLLEEGKIKIPEVTAFPLIDVAKAHQFLESGKSTGKIVLIPN